MFPIVWYLKQIKCYFILFSMQNIIKNKTMKLFKNYYLSQIYLFPFIFGNKEKRIKKLFNRKIYKYKIC